MERVAIIVVDMWNKHWCSTFTERLASMVPRMNETLAAARDNGATIVHAPSDVLDFYADDAARLAMLDVPVAPLPAEKPFDPPLYGGPTDLCECAQHRPCRRRRHLWSRQHPDLNIARGDLIGNCDSEQELVNLCAARNIDTLVYMGVASNLCILHRKMGVINMVRRGFSAIVVSDLVKAITANGVNGSGRADPTFTPDLGTLLVQRHIERHVCPTVASADVIAGVLP